MILFVMALGLESGFSAEDVSSDPFISNSSNGHRMTILNHGLASLEDRLRLIENAKESIDVEYFIYRTDLSAKIFTQALIKKAREGVKIRMLLDYFMIKSDLGPFYTHELMKEGIEVKYYNTTPLINFFSAQYRNHRKVLLVDGEVAITGGRNIGDEYFDMHKDYNFLDRDVRIEGEIVKSIEETFTKTFNSKKSKIVERQKLPNIDDVRYRRNNNDDPFSTDTERFKRDLKEWKKSEKAALSFVHEELEEAKINELRDLGSAELDKSFEGTCQNISFFSEYPNLGRKNKLNDRIIKYNIFDRIKNSKEHVLIDSPYFIVDDELGGALKHALDNDIKIELLTNSLNSTDAIYVYAAFDTKINSWIKKNLHPFIFKGHRPESYNVLDNYAGEARFGVHAKTFVFDKKDILIGTYNVDPRSANYNSEMIISCENSPELADVVTEDIHTRMEGSIYLDSKEKVKEAEFYKTDFKKKVLYYLLKVPSNLFSFWL